MAGFFFFWSGVINMLDAKVYFPIADTDSLWIDGPVWNIELKSIAYFDYYDAFSCLVVYVGRVH